MQSICIELCWSLKSHRRSGWGERERERNEASALWLGVSFLLEIKFVAELLQMDSSVFRSYLRLNCSHVTDSSVFTQSFTTDVSTKSQRIGFSRRFDVKLAVKFLNPALDLLWYNMWDECRKPQRVPWGHIPVSAFIYTEDELNFTFSSKEEQTSK